MKFSFSKPKVTQIEPTEAQQRLTARTAVIVDVREPNEWADGHIPGATHIPLGDLQARAGEIASAPEVIFVCWSGARSATAARALEQRGHATVASLAGGMQAWQRAGLPVKR